jgi:hypothetical protein
MRTPVALTLASLGLLSVLSLHCGGRVDEHSCGDFVACDDPPACPTNLTGACSVQGTCTETTTDCAGTHKLTCQCDLGKWVCPELGAPQCANECANARQGGLCSTKNLTCDAATQPVCPGPIQYKDTCQCDGTRFVCSITDCNEPPPPVPACPPPSVVSSGGACSAPGWSTCPGYVQCGDGSTADISCSCTSGHWFCESFVDPCTSTVDGGSAPKDAGTE